MPDADPEEPLSLEERFERFVSPFFHEASLWPITFVLVAHLVLAMSILLLEAWRGRGVPGLLAVAALAGLTVDVARRDLARGRLGPIAGTLLASWALGAVAAYWVDRWGLW